MKLRIKILTIVAFSMFSYVASAQAKECCPCDKSTKAKTSVVKKKTSKKHTVAKKTPIVAKPVVAPVAAKPVVAPVAAKPVVAKKPVEKKKRSKFFVQGGRATYIKSELNEVYLNTGIGYEESIKFGQSYYYPELILGFALNQYTSPKNQNMYDVNLLAGPKFRSNHFELDIQGLAGVVSNSKGSTTSDAGGQVKFGLNFGSVSTQVFMGRSESFSKFGLSVGYSF